MATRAALTAILAMAMSLFSSPGLAADGPGTISGRVVDRTAGAAAIGEMDVKLHTMSGGTEETAPAVATRTDATGAFTFRGLSLDAKTAYIVTTAYREVEYASEVVAFKVGETTRTVEVSVYETTDKADRISLRQQHLIVTPDPENAVIQVVEIAIVQNSGDRTYVGVGTGDEPQTVKLILPRGAFDVNMVRLLANRSALIDGGVAYTGPIAPGQTELVLGYALDYDGGSYTLEKLVSLATDAVDILVVDAGLVVRSQQLYGPESVEIGGDRYLRLTAKNLAAGSVVRFDLLPAADASSPLGLGSLGSLAPFGLLLAVGAGSVYLVLAPRLRRPVPSSPRAVTVRARRETAPEPERDETPEDFIER